VPRRVSVLLTAATLAVAAFAASVTGPSADAAAHSTVPRKAVPITTTAATATPTLRLVRSTYFRTAARVTAPPAIRARSWVVADMDTGRILAAHRRHDRLPQASTIKLLTALTAADRVPENPTHRITYREAHPQFCTCAGLKVGARYTRTALMAGMLLPSGNDAAEALAGSDPAGRTAFVAAANAKAAALGARNTVVVTPSGLTAAGAHSSAYDLLVFLRAALASPTVRPVLELPSFRLGPVGGRTHTVYRGTDYVRKYAGALGKSGYTTPARNTLVVDTPVAGHHIGVATLGAPGGYSTSGAHALTAWAAANIDALGSLQSLPAVPAVPPVS
jgi:serine-type D-Ala-D-Ala carboxypeptidase (penicillin-binding protein 5/6)